MSERYSVSRVVIRNAMRILANKGLLDIRRGKGAVVQNRRNWALLDDDILAWHLSADHSLHFVDQLMETRIAFEPKVARWAAERATGDELMSIRAIYDELLIRKDCEESFVVANASFHSCILSCAHNEILMAMEGIIYSAILISVPVISQDLRDPESIRLYTSIHQSIVERDGERAEKCTEQLLADTRNRLQVKKTEKSH